MCSPHWSTNFAGSGGFALCMLGFSTFSCCFSSLAKLQNYFFELCLKWSGQKMRWWEKMEESGVGEEPTRHVCTWHCRRVYTYFFYMEIYIYMMCVYVCVYIYIDLNLHVTKYCKPNQSAPCWMSVCKFKNLQTGVSKVIVFVSLCSCETFLIVFTSIAKHVYQKSSFFVLSRFKAFMIVFNINVLVWGSYMSSFWLFSHGSPHWSTNFAGSGGSFNH